MKRQLLTNSTKALNPRNKKEDPNWERYGIILALIGTLVTSFFALVQMRQTQAQIEQGIVAIQQTQQQLNDTKKQNTLASEQLRLAQDQFNYSRKQDSARLNKETLSDIENAKQYNENIRLLTAQTKALTQNNEVAINSQAPDVRTIVKVDTSTFRIESDPDIEPKFNWSLRIFSENYGGRSAVILPSLLFRFPRGEETYIFMPEYWEVPKGEVSSIEIDALELLPNKAISQIGGSRLLSEFILEERTIKSLDSIERATDQFFVLALWIEDKYTKKRFIQFTSFRIIRQATVALNEVIFSRCEITYPPLIIHNKLISHIKKQYYLPDQIYSRD